MMGRILKLSPKFPPLSTSPRYNLQPLIVGGPVTITDIIPWIRVHYMAKVKGFCSCNEGPISDDSELTKRENILGGPDLVQRDLQRD